MNEQQIVSKYAPLLQQQLTILCNQVLTPLLEMLSESLYHEAFIEALVKLYRLFVTGK
jgi:hypothetical protein